MIDSCAAFSERSRPLGVALFSIFMAFFAFATNTASGSSNTPLSYQVVEKLPVGTQIGRGLVIDAGLSSTYSSDQLDGLRFSLVRDPTSGVASRHINVLPQSGLLEVSAKLLYCINLERHKQTAAHKLSIRRSISEY